MICGAGAAASGGVLGCVGSAGRGGAAGACGGGLRRCSGATASGTVVVVAAAGECGIDCAIVLSISGCWMLQLHLGSACCC